MIGGLGGCVGRIAWLCGWVAVSPGTIRGAVPDPCRASAVITRPVEGESESLPSPPTKSNGSLRPPPRREPPGLAHQPTNKHRLAASPGS